MAYVQKIHIRLIFCLILLLESSGHEEIDKPDIEKFLKEGYSVTNFEGHEDFIVLMGGTGSGKSTLLKFLSNDTSLRVEANSGEEFIFVDNEITIGSENSLASKTLYPNIVLDPQTNSVMVDCAGFQDSRAPEYDLVAGFLNKLILDNAKRLKIVIVENHWNVQLNNERSGFSTTLKHLAKIIGKNVNSFNGSLGLVATKIDSSKSDKQLIKAIKAFLKKVHMKLSVGKEQSEDVGRQKEIVNILMNGDNVAIFRRPDELGDGFWWNLESLDKNYHQIRKLFFQTLNFTSPFLEKFGVTVSARTVNHINKDILSQNAARVNDLYREFFDDLMTFFRRKIGINLRPIDTKIDLVIKYCKNYIKILDEVHSFDQLESFISRRGVTKNGLIPELRFQLSKTQFLFEVSGNDANDIDEKIKEFYKWKPFLRSNINAALDYFIFLKGLSVDVDSYDFQVNINQMQQQLSQIDKNDFKILSINWRAWGVSQDTALSALKTNGINNNSIDMQIFVTEKMTNHSVQAVYIGNSVFFSGSFIQLSNILESIYKNASRLHEIVIIGSKKVFIDCDFELQHTHLVILAPVLEIIGKHSIYLKGEHGAQHPPIQKSKTKGFSGPNGLNGRNGFSSGNVRFYALEVRNSKLLTVKTEGGNGGNGQRGGDGLSAQDVPKPGINIYELGCPVHNENICSSNGLVLLNVTKCIATYVKTDIIFDTLTTYAYVTLQNSIAPTNGGYGGNAGLGAFAGTQSYFVNNSIQHITQDYRNGKSGDPGSGGKGGVEHCIHHYYECYIHFVCECILKEEGTCPPNFPLASDGLNGSARTIQFNYKHTAHTELFQLILHFCQFIVNNERSLEEHPETQLFLRHLLTSQEFVSQFKLHHFLSFLTNTEEFDFLSNKGFTNGHPLFALKFVYATMYESFKKVQQICDHCDRTIVRKVDLIFISRLDSLHTLEQGKTVIDLSASVDQQLKDLSNIETLIQRVGTFQTVKDEKDALLKSIADAGKLIDEKHKEKMKEIQESANANFQELVIKTAELKDEYEDNIKTLNDHKNKLADQIWTNLAMGIVNTLGAIGNTFFQPAGVLSSTFTTVGSEILPNAGELDIDSHRPKIPQGLQNARRIINKLRDDKRHKERIHNAKLVQTLKETLKVEQEEGVFLKIDTRKNVENLVSEFEVSSKNDLNVPTLNFVDAFETVINDLDIRINSLEMLNGTETTLNIYRTIKSSLDKSQHLAQATVVAVATGYQFANDQRKQEQIEAAIKVNEVAVKEMAEFEENLHSEFKPMFDEMISTFDNFQTDLQQNQTSTFALEFQKLDIKNYARKCIALVNQFLQDFVRENDGLAGVLFDLQDFMATIVEVYDKIYEMRYRVQLTDFLGQLHGQSCANTLTSDPQNCIMFQNISSQIKTNEVIREFIYIFTAYQQVLFPYGGAKMNTLKSIISLLVERSSLTLQEKADHLKDALEAIRKDLSELNHSIVNDRDKHIVMTHFNSEYSTSAGPFFVWPSSKYSEQIKALFNGELVTFVASVLAPEVKNAVKFKSIGLNFNTSDGEIANKIKTLLKDNFRVEMIHGGESYYRCGSTYYALGGEKLTLKKSFALDDEKALVYTNNVVQKLENGNVHLSPYTVWKFKLTQISRGRNINLLRQQLSELAGKVDMELVGKGYYVEEEAPICETDLGQFYSYFNSY